MDDNFKNILIPAIISLLSMVILFIVRGVAAKTLQRWADKTETDIDDIIISAIKTPSIYLTIAIGLYIGVAISGLPENYVFYISKAIHVIVIMSIAFAIAGLSGKILDHYIRKSNLPIPSTGLAHGIVKITIIILGVLITLSVLGISIAPLITAMGVGGLAVALALQDTLSNLFAGIHILVEKSVKVGDFVRLESGQEGYVDDITWRTTRIRMLPNNMVIIPNNKLSQSIVTNYSLPDKEMAISIPISVSYNADPDRVEQVLTEEMEKAADEIHEICGTSSSVRFHKLGESSIDFEIVCHIREYENQKSVQHQILKRVFKRFREEGIEIPYPQRVVYVKRQVRGNS
ncbi:MAG: mechanosensitive ion channel family protein [Nitrospirae bacterium]|nr:mechanosensitive ion channel family protein [Nitrospirota bacterium]